ncbi:hypothetical protein AGMMS50229_00920 [Campylobacterota bacterium]|nr:hypothetical protein AGMMS50229_00920 [Campylobacterota bacterium]
MQALRDWQNKRRDQTVTAVKDAIASLNARNETINFRTVAIESKITRKTLYAVSELRLLIGEAKNNGAIDGAKEFRRISELENEVKKLKDLLYAIRAQIPPL